jgi:uncharacterized protein
MEVSMRIIDYKNGLEFLNENKQLLLEREAVSQLLLFNALQNKETLKSTDCVFGKALDEDGNLCFLFGNTKPYNCLIYVPKAAGKRKAYITLVDYLLANNCYINGINANKLSCDTFCEVYKKKVPGAVFEEHLSMDIMELRYLADVSLAEGKCSAATKQDIPLIARWIIAFNLEALSSTISYEEVIDKITAGVEKGSYYIFRNEQGIPVSMAATARKLINGTAISYVYTPKEVRGRGYAATNMYYLGKKLLSEGNDFCCLFVDKKNPISNRVYKKIGYVILEDNYDYRLSVK